jgi:F420H(2)-dependent quinone reductase
MTARSREQVNLPPRPLIRSFWALHRAAYRLTGGRFGLRRPERGTTFGMLRLHTQGRRSGHERIAMIGYFEDGPNLVTLAMNGWGSADPAWWLNLQHNPVAKVDLPDGTRLIRARSVTGPKRDALWAAFAEYPGWGPDLDALAAQRPGETTVVVLEPVTGGTR